MEIDCGALVSIIVPIYNVELYIRECVKSLITQTYENIEIILVDDGSPDRCGDIIDEFAQSDSRITVIHKVNSGVSAARNDGLELANGKYVMFVDGDDFVEPDYVSYFVELIDESNCGIGVGKNAFYHEGQQQIEKDSFDKIAASDIIEGIYLNHYNVAVWNKIYRRDVITTNALKFDTDYWYAEGMLFNIMYLQYVDIATVGKKRVYHARENPESATRSFKLENQYCGMRSMVFQKAQWQKSNIGIKTSWEYHFRLYAKNILQGLMLTNGKKSNKKLYRKCIRILRKNLRVPLQANISTVMKENSILMAICPTGFIRDELGFIHAKGDNSDYISRHLLSVARRVLKRIPISKKETFFERLKLKLQKYYRPKYLEKKLL